MTTTALATRPAELMLAGPLGSLDHYIQAANAIPVLTAEEEFELATRLREHNDLDAARRLVLSHLRFVIHVARGYAGYGLQLADLIQEGNIGLMKAVRRFDPNVGVRLVSFAVHWIRAEIHEFVIIKTDLEPDALPTAADGSVDEAGAGIEVIDEIEDIPAGESADPLAVDLEAGSYVLICNIVDEDVSPPESHYQEGMHTAFTVE